MKITKGLVCGHVSLHCRDNDNFMEGIKCGNQGKAEVIGPDRTPCLYQTKAPMQQKHQCGNQTIQIINTDVKVCVDNVGMEKNALFTILIRL